MGLLKSMIIEVVLKGDKIRLQTALSIFFIIIGKNSLNKKANLAW